MAQRKEIISFEVQKTFVGGGNGTWNDPYTYAEYQGGSNSLKGTFYYYDQDGEICSNLKEAVVVGGTQTTNNNNSTYLSFIQFLNNQNNMAGNFASGMEHTGETRFGSNYKIYFASSNGVFYGNQYVKTNSLVKIGGKIGKITGSVGVVLGAGLVLYAVYEDGGEIGNHTKGAAGGFIGGTAGAFAGAWAGGKAGAFLGFIISGPVGAAIGGFIGGTAGSFAGGFLGEEAFENITK